LKRHRTIAAEAWRIELATPAKIVRVQLTGTAHGISMQPHQQALQEYPEQQALYKEIHDLLDAPLPRYTVQMWARAGYGPRVEPAPRRGLEAQIVKPPAKLA